MRRQVKLVALVAALVVVAGACQRAAEEEPISLEVTGPAQGTTVEGNVVDLALEVSGITIVAAADDPGTGGTGHFHVFIDREPVEAGEAIPTGQPDIIHSAANPIKLTGLSVGEHRLLVILGDKTHVRIGDTEAETTLDVQGPSVHAFAPATARADLPVPVGITVEGVAIVAAAEDMSNKDGTAGHLHVFVNKDPTPAGTAIPTGDPAIIHTASAAAPPNALEIPIDLFKAGENIIWVVLGYADHTPFDPPVMDRVVVTVP
jgi:hypothetical protein